MRIDHHHSSTSLDRKKETDSPLRTGDKDIDFKEVLHYRYQQNASDKLTKLLSDIDLAGQKLANSKTARDLTEYKKLVKAFMDEAVKNGIGMEDRQGSNSYGRPRHYKVITELNAKLLEVTDEVLQKEQKGIDLLGKIGEIRGMLVNFYF